MKKFLFKTFAVIGIPFVILLITYIVLDPFRVVFPFQTNYFFEKSIGKTNREYLSYNLYNANYKSQQYNSFIIGSSRTCALNSYQWKRYLDEDAEPFIWTSWRENISGISQKLRYLDKSGTPISNVLVVLDCGNQYSFNVSNGNAPLTNHYYKFSGECALKYQIDYFASFLSKPSQWIDFIKDYSHINYGIPIDTLTNDSQVYNDTITQCPLLPNTPVLVREQTDIQETELPAYIDADIQKELEDICAIFAKHHTCYKILICPNSWLWKINHEDLLLLQDIFGQDKIYDYSGENAIASSPYSYSDEEHFNSNVGWRLIEEMYSPR